MEWFLWKRHGGEHHDGSSAPHHHHHHHKDNTKCGNLILGIAILSMIILGILNLFHSKYGFNSILKNKRLMKTVSYLKSISLIWQMIFWSSLTIITSLSPIIKEKLINEKTLLNSIRRSGKVAFALMPFIVFLGIRPNPLPNTFYLSLLPLHKWLSRLMIFISALHTMGYFIKWILHSELSKVLKPANLMGLISIILFLNLVIVSLKPMRRNYYNFFYSIHTITAYFTIIIITYHARFYSNIYTFICLLLIFYGFFCKIKYSKLTKFQILQETGSNLSLVRFPITDYQTNFTPGSHLRISGSLTSIKSWIFSTHPFTISSIPSDPTIDLIIKKTHYDINEVNSYMVSQPFPAIHANFFKNVNKLTIICGGSGIGFGLPLFRHFMELRKNNELEENHELELMDIKLIWIIKNLEDLFILKSLNILNKNNEVEEFHKGHLFIYHTGNNNTDSNKKSFLPNIINPIKKKLFKKNPKYQQLESNDSFELQTLKTSEELERNDLELESFSDLTPSDEDIPSSSDSSTDFEFIKKGRPDLSEYLEPLITDSLTESNWVVSCGPSGLVKDCNDWCLKNKIGHISEIYSV